MLDNLLPAIFLVGVAFTLIGLVALIAKAFRQTIWWGLGVLIFPPVGLVFAARHPKKASIPIGLILLGALMAAGPAIINRYRVVDLGPLERVVKGERHLTLTGWDRKDYSVLRSKPETAVLQMANPDVTDDTLELLAGMDRLRELDLNGTAVTDVGLKSISKLPALEILRLRDTKITDGGFRDSLSPMKTLKQLDLRGTAVSKESVQSWKDGISGRRALQ